MNGLSNTMKTSQVVRPMGIVGRITAAQRSRVLSLLICSQSCSHGSEATGANLLAATVRSPPVTGGVVRDAERRAVFSFKTAMGGGLDILWCG